MHYRSDIEDIDGAHLYLVCGCVAFSCVNHDTEEIKSMFKSSDFNEVTLDFIKEYNSLFKLLLHTKTPCPWCQKHPNLKDKEQVLQHCMQHKKLCWKHEVCAHVQNLDYPFVKKEEKPNPGQIH